MAKALEVKVSWDRKTNIVGVSDEEAVVYFDTPGEPDSIVWAFDGKLPEGIMMKVAWDVAAPFFKVSRDMQSNGILGTWNNEEPGTYDYSVVFVDTKTRQVVAGFDPKVRNEPPPIEG
jgi:hypothetical protein